MKYDPIAEWKVGRCLHLFDYIKKRMKLKTELDALNTKAVSLTKATGGVEWKFGGREEGVLYKADPPARLGLGSGEMQGNKLCLVLASIY